jgi:uncharacterized membrane protein YpjA
MRRYRLILAMVCVINLLGTVAGFFYYKWQLASSPKLFWAFIPDSPGSTLLFAIAVGLIFFERKVDVLSYLASVGVVKYGFWTMFVIAFYSDYFLSPANRSFYYLMFVLHFGMIVEPVVVLHTIDFKVSYVLLALAWFGLNDYIDYVIGYTPLAGFSFSRIDVVGYVTAASTVMISLGFYALKRYKSVLEDFFLKFEKA